MEVVEKKIVFAFNSLSLMFVKELKKQHDQLRVVIKKNYRAYDKSSSEYINCFWDSLKDIPEVDKILIPEGAADTTEDEASNIDVVPTNAFVDSRLHNSEILKSLTIQKILSLVPEENHPMVFSYLYGLYLFAYLRKDLTEDNVEDIDTLLTRSIQSMDDNVDLEECLSDILDDDVRYLIRRMKMSQKFTMPKVHDVDTNDQYMNMFEGTKIGELAKDISEKIDMEKLGDMSNLSNLFESKDGTNMIGNIIQQVGQTITGKLQSGELNHQDLMSEAMGMMGGFANNPMMKNMMQSMMNGGMGMGGGMGGGMGMGIGAGAGGRQSRNQRHGKKQLR